MTSSVIMNDEIRTQDKLDYYMYITLTPLHDGSVSHRRSTNGLNVFLFVKEILCLSSLLFSLS